jgi:hypothetical protein
MTTNDNNENLDSPALPVIPIRRQLLFRILHLIADRNPFYLISAACMLGGCLALTNSLSWLSLPLERLLLLIATINIYEAALIGLALLLLKRHLMRDGNILLILEAFFLVDVSFLNAEVATANFHLGIFISILLFALAVIKLRLIMRALGADLSPARFANVMLQIAALLTIPCVLRGIDHGSVSSASFYAIWWIVGLLPIIEEITLIARGSAHVSHLSGTAALFVSLPLISLIAHVGILHYVYGAEYFGAMAAPLLLGLAILLKRATASSIGTRQQLLAVRVLLPLAAVIVSLNNPHVLMFSLHPISSITVTPTHLATAGAYLTYIYCFLMPLAGWFLAIGGLLATAFFFGPSFDTIEQVIWRCWTWIVDFTNWIIPKTLTAWGIVSVLASFFFLLLGAAVSLAKPRPVVDEIDPPSV